MPQVHINPTVLTTLALLVGLLGVGTVLTGSIVQVLKLAIGVRFAKGTDAYQVVVQSTSCVVGALAMVVLLLIFTTGADARAVALAALFGIGIGFTASGHFDFLSTLRSFKPSGPPVVPPAPPTT